MDWKLRNISLQYIALRRSETPGKFWNVVLEKDGEVQLDRSCEKLRSITYSQGAEDYPAWNKQTEG